MFRMGGGSLCVVLLVVGGVSADPRSDIAALKNQVKGLKKEQEFTIKSVQARYRAIKTRDRLTEAELRFERAEIKRQEEVALALTSSAAERQQIRANYDALRNYLTVGIKLDQAEIRLLSEQEKALIQYIKTLYGARINQLEQRIHYLERLKPPRKK